MTTVQTLDAERRGPPGGTRLHRVRYLPARPQHLPKLAPVRAQAIRQAGPAHYSATQIEAWIGQFDPAPVQERDDGPTTFVAALGRRIVGYSTLRLGDLPHVWALYVHPACGGSGLGTRLLELVEGRARCAGHRRIGVCASRNAAGFYRHRGYAAERAFAVSLPAGAGEALDLGAVAMFKDL